MKVWRSLEIYLLRYLPFISGALLYIGHRWWFDFRWFDSSELCRPGRVLRSLLSSAQRLLNSFSSLSFLLIQSPAYRSPPPLVDCVNWTTACDTCRPPERPGDVRCSLGPSVAHRSVDYRSAVSSVGWTVVIRVCVCVCDVSGWVSTANVQPTFSQRSYDETFNVASLDDNATIVLFKFCLHLNIVGWFHVCISI